MPDVEVALVGRALEPLTWEQLAPEWWETFDYTGSVPWDARRRVSLAVKDDESLREILVRAVEAFGGWENDWDDPSFGGSRHGDDRPGTRRFIALRNDLSPIPVHERLSVALTTVDADGRALWGKPYQPVTYAELRRASEAGAVPGDPAELFLSVRPDAAGGGIGHEWSLLLQAWDVAWKVVLGLVAGNELHDLSVKIRNRLAGREVVDAKTEDWLRRNGYADSIAYMLRGEPWSAFDLAGLLGCTVDQAKEVLGLYGYAQGEGDSWEYAAGNERLGLPVHDVSARAIVAFAEEVQRRYTDGQDAPLGDLERLFREIIRQAANGDVGDLSHIKTQDPFEWELEKAEHRSSVMKRLARQIRRS